MSEFFHDSNIQTQTSAHPSAVKIPLLENLPASVSDKLRSAVLKKTLWPNTFLFKEGDKVDAIYVIQKGRVKLSRYDAAGRETIISIFSDHDTIWESMFLGESRFPYSAICLTNVEILEIRRKDFQAVISDPVVSMNTILLLSQKLHDANQRNMFLSLRDPSARMAGFLLYRDERCVGPEIHMKLDDIAASVALRPETVSRVISHFQKDGLIRRAGQGRLLILDKDGLARIYNGGLPDSGSF